MPTTTPPGRREAAKTAKRDRIVAAATRLLTGEGYDAMTMAQVATDADVAVGTVFTYAATKAELLMMVTARRWAGSVAAALAAHADDDPVVAIRALLHPVLDSTRLEPQTSAAIARELMFGAPGPHQAEVLALVAELEMAIARIIARDEPDARQFAAARLVVSGALLEVNRERTGRAGADGLEARLTRLVEIVLEGARS